MRAVLAPVLAVVLPATLAACGPDERQNPTVDAPASQADAPGSVVDAPPATDTSRVFAHVSSDRQGGPQDQPDRLFQLNAMTFNPIEIGPITGLEGTQQTEHLQDLAIDSNDRMYGVTASRIFTIDPQTGAATYVANLPVGSFFSSLSFVPAADASAPDILVSANGDGDVIRIDVTGSQATATVIGNYGMKDGKQIRSSGDLFGVRGFGLTGIYATVDLEGETEDYLASIDPANGWKATLIGTGTGFDKIFGLGFWGGKIYGFVDEGFEAGTGKVIEIDPTTGIAAVKNSGAFRWFGAGVATDAPVIL